MFSLEWPPEAGVRLKLSQRCVRLLIMRQAGQGQPQRAVGEVPGQGLHQQEGPAGPLAQEALKNSSTRATAEPTQQQTANRTQTQTEQAVAGSTTERGRETTLKV